jgi:hypothetical protein
MSRLFIETDMSVTGSTGTWAAASLVRPPRHIAQIPQSFVTLRTRPAQPVFPAHLQVRGAQDLARSGVDVVPVAVQFQVVHYPGNTGDVPGNERGLLEIRAFPHVAGEVHDAAVGMNENVLRE